MKIRDGFVTNSSSTNFIIICKEEITVKYLFEKLGFEIDSPLKELGERLCEEIMYGTSNGLRWHEINELNYEVIRKIFGEKTASKYTELTDKGYYVYLGHTGNDDELINFFTTDSFILDDVDFFLNGENCVW